VTQMAQLGGIDALLSDASRSNNSDETNNNSRSSLDLNEHLSRSCVAVHHRSPYHSLRS